MQSYQDNPTKMIKLGFVIIAWTRHINITSFELSWTDNINIMTLREWLCKSDEISHSTMLSTFRSAGYWSTWNIFWKVRVVQKAVRFAPFGCDYCCRISAGEAASEPSMWGERLFHLCCKVCFNWDWIWIGLLEYYFWGAYLCHKFISISNSRWNTQQACATEHGNYYT